MGGNRKWRKWVELAAVLLIALAVFALGRAVALVERGYPAYGGEYCAILLPFLYYLGKSMR